MFDKRWFEKHQKLLIWFANTFLGRYILRINGDRSSVGNRKIIKIVPNAIFWKKSKYSKFHQAEFRTHDKFSKRIYYAFKPIWLLFHFWDTVFANRIAPNFNLGFDRTLTAYPDAGSGGTTVDGFCQQSYGAGSGVSWATLIAAAGNGHNTTSDDTDLFYIAQDTGTNTWKNLRRTLYTLNTAPLTSVANISAATFSIKGTAKLDNSPGITPTINLYGSTPAANNDLADGDYAQVQSTAYSTAITYAAFDTANYNDWALNATGLAAVSKTGITKFSIRNANYDVAATPPAWDGAGEHYMDGLLADAAGTTNDPKLVITYTLTASTNYLKNVRRMAFRKTAFDANF